MNPLTEINFMNLDRQNLIAALRLPGDKFKKTLVKTGIVDRPTKRPGDLPGDGLIAAVMVLFFTKFGNTYLVLTKRRSDLRKHANQISLPGGRNDKGESLRETAVRETVEEIGVDRQSIEILGPLQRIYIPPSDFTVQPFVAWHQSVPEFVRSETEVDEIIEAPVSKFVLPDSLKNGIVESGKDLIEVEYYDVFGHSVWGATAIILAELMDRLGHLADG